MNTVIVKINQNEFKEEELAQAARILREGGLVAFPTETVYGLGADGLNDQAAHKIYAAKGRPSDNPLILHIASMEALEDLTTMVPESARKMADAFWPGPLTMIFHKSDKVPYGTTGGLDTVAIRMPEHPISRELIRLSGVYVAAPSANTSGRPSPTMAEHVIEDMNGKIDMIIDGGAVGIGLESTIVDMTSEVPTILRPGYITKSMIEKVIGPVEVDRAILESDSKIKPKAPGMKYKHYAPVGDITIFEGNMGNVVLSINERAKEKVEQGKKVGVIATDETLDEYRYGIVKTIGTRSDDDSIARSLFALLREFDQLGVEYIYSESFDDDDLGQAIMNRLLKAAGHHVVTV